MIAGREADPGTAAAAKLHQRVEIVVVRPHADRRSVEAARHEVLLERDEHPYFIFHAASSRSASASPPVA